MTNKLDSYQALLEQIWADEDFKNRFIAYPKAVLAEVGAQVPDSVKVEVHESSPSLRNYVLLKKAQLEGANLAGEDPIVNQVLKKALDDDAFKAKLLENPKAAIKEVASIDLPEDLTICVYEDTSNVKHLVIPVNPNNEELGNLELEMVAGGKTVTEPSIPQGPSIPDIKLPQPGTMGMIATNQWFGKH